MTLTAKSTIELSSPSGDIKIANDLPFVLFGGMNVLESQELAFEIAESYIEICKKLDIGYVFKASLIGQAYIPFEGQALIRG